MKRIATMAILTATATLLAEVPAGIKLTDRPWRAITHEAPAKLAEARKITENGRSAWLVSADYSDGGKTCGIELNCEPMLDIDALTLQMRSPAKMLGVGVTDSAGQSFLRLWRLSGKPDFLHRLEIDRFDAPAETRFYWHWGGKNDGVLRPPIRRIQLRTFGDSGPAGKTAWSDCYSEIHGLKTGTAEKTAPAAAVAALEPDVFPVLSPENPTDWHLRISDWPKAAKGTFNRFAAGVLKVRTDFSGGGTIGVARNFYGGIRANGMTFQIKSPLKRVFIDVQDFRRQTFSQSVPLSGNPAEWQTVAVRSFHGPKENGFRWYGGFDGATGVFRYPAETVAIQWSAGDAPGATETEIRNIYFHVPESPEIALKAPSQLLAFTGEPHAAEFRLFTAPGRIVEVEYRIRNYDGESVTSGKAPVNGVDFRVSVPKERGFYDIEFPGFGVTFGQMVLDRSQGTPDPFFGIDANLSVNRRTESEVISGEYLKLLRNAGIQSIHDRTLWRILEPERDVFRWNNRNADVLHHLYEQYGFRVLDTLDGAPRWTGAVPERHEEGFFPYPRDLAVAGDSLAAILERYAGFRDGIEVWNEPENSFGAWMPGDQVTAFQKLLVYEMKSRGIAGGPVIGGGMTGNVISPRLMKSYCANGMIGNSDVFSFHTYHGAESMVPYIKIFRDLIAADPNGTLPFRVTESGWGWQHGNLRAPAEADAISAFQTTMKAVECKAAGVERYYLFTLPYYEEPPTNFGLFDARHSPHRHLHTFLNLSRVLGHAVYLGDVAGQTGATINRVFADGRGGAVIVAYSGEWKADFTPPAGLKINRAETIDGRPLAAENGRYPIRNGMIYLFAAKSAVGPFLTTDTEAMRQLEIVRNHKPRRLPVKPGILTFDFPREGTAWTHNGYRFDNAVVELPVRFNNPGREPLVFVPQATLPPGGKLFAGLPEKLEVPAGMSRTATLKIDLGDCFPVDALCDLTVADRNGNATDLVIPLIRPGREKQTAEPLPERFRIPETFSGLDGWTRLDDGRKHWKMWEGPMLPNVRVAFRVFYTPEKLRLVVLADEKVFHQPYLKFDVWKADSVQFTLRTLDSKARKRDDFNEYCAAQTSAGPIVLRSRAESTTSAKPGLLAKSTLKFDRIGNLSRYVIDLDRTENGLPEFKSGTEFGFSFLVNNSEGKVRDGYVFWGGGIGDFKSADAFYRLVFQ